MTVALLLAVMIGLSLSVLGSGGSIITVPVLVYAARQSPQNAVPMSLAIVGGVSALGVGMLLANTMKRMKLEKKDLVELTNTVSSGVGEVIRKQEEGYAYIKSGG
jgi:intracellular sulfur oxidation DsrE/DsrF family protein